jgi:phosphoribosylformylglycinamidine cyclo-ligase
MIKCPQILNYLIGWIIRRVNMNSYSESYKAAGVDVTAGYKAVELIKAHVARTAIPGVVSGIGGFGGLFELDLEGYKHPILVSGTDGVGTKLKIAFLMNRHETVGIDCVAMCVNDVICGGAKPLFFLDYIAVGKNEPERIEKIVSGVAEGCIQAGCGLVGGETAEMPGFYPEDEYDLAGFCVGIVEKDKMIDGSKVKTGDALIGLASSGVHSNGFSLVRKIFSVNADRLKTYVDELSGTIGEVLLAPTKIYVKSLLGLNDTIGVNAVSHITGGGFYENIPRMLPEGKKAVIHKSSFKTPPIFGVIERLGKVPERDMFNTFNMGIGLVIAVDSDKADEAMRYLTAAGEQAYLIGEVADGERGVELC